MRIATGKKSETGLVFEVEIPGLNAFFITLVRSEQQSDRAPDWHAIYEGQRCGAFWKKIPNGGGEAFLSGHLESPLFPGGRLDVAVFAAKEAGSQKDMVWSPRRDDRSAPSDRPTASFTAASSTASGSGSGEDDDISF